MMITKHKRLRFDTRVQSLCSQLKTIAYTKGPDSKLPTVRELCESLEVSPTTLNDALKELERQNVILRRRGSGIFVSPKLYHKSIAIVFGSRFYSPTNVVSPFWGMLQSLFISHAQHREERKGESHSFHLLQSPGNPNEAAIPNGLSSMIQMGQVHGVLGVSLDIPTYEYLKDKKIPVVAFAGYGAFQVYHDFHAFNRMAIDQLAVNGCRRIGYMRYDVPDLGNETSGNIGAEIDQQGASINKILAEKRLPMEAIPIRNRVESDHAPIRSLSTQEQGYQTGLMAFGPGSTNKPDGLIITDDMLTSGLLIALRKLGIQPGRDVKIATSANLHSPTLFGCEDELILVEYDPAEVVSVMFDTLEALMNGNSPSENLIGILPKLRNHALSDLGVGA